MLGRSKPVSSHPFTGQSTPALYNEIGGCYENDLRFS